MVLFSRQCVNDVHQKRLQDFSFSDPNRIDMLHRLAKPNQSYWAMRHYLCLMDSFRPTKSNNWNYGARITTVAWSRMRVHLPNDANVLSQGWTNPVTIQGWYRQAVIMHRAKTCQDTRTCAEMIEYYSNLFSQPGIPVCSKQTNTFSLEPVYALIETTQGSPATTSKA